MPVIVRATLRDYGHLWKSQFKKEMESFIERFDYAEPPKTVRVFGVELRDQDWYKSLIKPVHKWKETWLYAWPGRGQSSQRGYTPGVHWYKGRVCVQCGQITDPSPYAAHKGEDFLREKPVEGATSTKQGVRVCVPGLDKWTGAGRDSRGLKKGMPPWGRFQLPDAEAQRKIVLRRDQFRLAIAAKRGTEEQRQGLQRVLRIMGEARARIGRAWRSKASCEIELSKGTSTTRRTVIPRGRVTKEKREGDPARSECESDSDGSGEDAAKREACAASDGGDERSSGGVKRESVKCEADAASDVGSWGSGGQASSSSSGDV